MQLIELWVTPSALVAKIEAWGEEGQWRQKRYVSMLLKDIPEEVLTDLIGYYMDSQPEEDHQQTSLF
jgi:hypothetical protein